MVVVGYAYRRTILTILKPFCCTGTTFVDTWVRIFGFPDVLVLDPGTEFDGHFTDQTMAHGVTILPIDRETENQQLRYATQSLANPTSNHHN